MVFDRYRAEKSTCDMTGCGVVHGYERRIATDAPQTPALRTFGRTLCDGSYLNCAAIVLGRQVLLIYPMRDLHHARNAGSPLLRTSRPVRRMLEADG